MGLKYRFTHAIDTPERTLEHAGIIRKKYFLRKLYTTWYQELFSVIPDISGKKVVELGSGGGFLKEFAPTVITSDFLDLPVNDMTFSALCMPFENQSLDALLMIDTFHHLPDARLFLKEVNRTLKPEGKMVMIEPANSLWGRWIYRHFHHEPFIPEGDWTIPESGPLSGANGALPWIVFERDAKLLEHEFPDLAVRWIRYHTPFLYLVSGGVSYRQLLPDFSYALVNLLDRWSTALSSQLSMFMTIVVEKNI